VQVFGGDGGVVQKTEAARLFATSVVTWWPAQGVVCTLATAHRVGRGQGRLCRPIGRLPGVFAYRAGRVGLVVARLANRRGGIAFAPVTRVHVGQDLVGGAGHRDPVRVDGLEEVQVLGCSGLSVSWPLRMNRFGSCCCWRESKTAFI